MPVFPSFMRRMQQTSPAQTLFQGGITPRPYEIEQPAPPVRSSADRIRETVANQVRYEDVAPKLEQIPTTPPFVPKAHYGILDRLKMAAGGAGLGQQRGGGLGALGGIIAGLINPAGVDRAGYAAYKKPRYDADAQAVMGRNKARMDNFETEMKARETISKINEAGRPKYKQATGSALTMVYDENTGEFKPAMMGDEPVEAASVVVGRGHDTTQRMVEKQKTKAAWDRLMQTLESREGIASQDRETRKAIAEGVQRGAMNRLRISEGGKWGRQKRQLQAEGYDLSEGSGTGAGTGTGPARPGGGAGNADTLRKLIDQLRKSGQMLGPVEDDEEQDDFWY
jgi:hypothetical protein